MSPKDPAWMCHVHPPSHWPVVGSALKLQGQPKSQLHAMSTVPLSVHGLAAPAVMSTSSNRIVRQPPHQTQSAMKTLVMCGSEALRLDPKTSFRPSGENIGKPSKSGLTVTCSSPVPSR